MNGKDKPGMLPENRVVSAKENHQTLTFWGRRAARHRSQDDNFAEEVVQPAIKFLTEAVDEHQWQSVQVHAVY